MNRTKHHAAFVKACEVFREKAIAELNAMTDAVARGDIRRLYVSLPVPEEHTADYDRAIQMLNLHLGDTVELSEEAFTRLVQDEWGWRNAFLLNTASYLAPDQS
jgi:hypothetical protein